MRYLKQYAVTFTVEGVPGDAITTNLSGWPTDKQKRKKFKALLTHRYGGRKVEILRVVPGYG